MRRAIERFTQDEHGDWVAHLTCLHRQHVRHTPPFREAPWVLRATGREAHVGADLPCPLCDRAELPDGLEVVRVAGPFDEGSLPDGLRRDHRVAPRTWGRLRVLEGAVRLTMATEPPIDREVAAGEDQLLPPDVVHAVAVAGPVRLVVELLARPDESRLQAPSDPT